ncbi:very-long-chain enoyl-CoA reductase-like protein [Tanacetum coccineum]
MSIISCLSLANGGYMETKGKHMQYSKFFNVLDTKKLEDHELKLFSRNGMILAYTPAFLVGLVSFAIFHNQDLRFIMAIFVLNIHSFKRVLEVLLFHKYSGSMALDAAIPISLSYTVSTATMIYAQYLSQSFDEPAIDLKYIGTTLFLIGITRNFYHHYILSHLRKKGDGKLYSVSKLDVMHDGCSIIVGIVSSWNQITEITQVSRNVESSDVVHKSHDDVLNDTLEECEHMIPPDADIYSKPKTDKMANMIVKPKPKLVLTPCSRMKMLHTQTSFTHRRLLPFMMSVAEDCLGTLKGNQSSKVVKGIEQIQQPLTLSLLHQNVGVDESKIISNPQQQDVANEKSDSPTSTLIPVDTSLDRIKVATLVSSDNLLDTHGLDIECSESATHLEVNSQSEAKIRIRWYQFDIRDI